jgi:hypothetical protein
VSQHQVRLRKDERFDRYVGSFNVPDGHPLARFNPFSPKAKSMAEARFQIDGLLRELGFQLSGIWRGDEQLTRRQFCDKENKDG